MREASIDEKINMTALILFKIFTQLKFIGGNFYSKLNVSK